MLDASREEAVLAVKLFNDPTGERNLEGFVVHMHLAWLYLLQAEWARARKDYRIPDNSGSRRKYKWIDGEYQTPALDWFVQQSLPEGDPVRANLDFFIRLRNKIEHRHSGSEDSLMTVISGHCHSLLLNYEERRTTVFGTKSSLATALRFPVFIGGFTEHGKETIVKLTNSLPADFRTFLADFDGSLDDAVSRDSRYCLRLTVVLEKGNRKGDLSIQFRSLDDLDESTREELEEEASKGFVITKHTQVPVANLNYMKAKAATDRVAEQVPYRFTSHHFTQAWKRGGYRPDTKAKAPEKTRKDFVVYDAPHKDYVYTPEYVKFLVKKCSTADGFREVTGSEPVSKPSSTPKM